MFHNNSQPLVHLQRRSPLPKPDTQIPRGECGFLELVHGERHRCTCRGFFASHDELPTRCGCGHPAWYHEAQPLRHVSVEEHMAVVEELKRLRREVEKERVYRKEWENMWKLKEQKLYENMKLMKMSLDDKIEEGIDKTHALSEKIGTVEDATMELELKLEKADIGLGRGLLSRSLTPVHETTEAGKSPEPERMVTELPIRTEKRCPESWEIKVIFCPHKSQPYAYSPDDVGYKRCQSRNLSQELRLSTEDSESFVSAVETAFKSVLKGRSWMPLIGYRPHNDHFGRMALKQLPTDLSSPAVWEHSFLDEHCIAHDKLQGNLLYIALTDEDLTWDEIKYLPMAFGSDETCWAHNEELDGKMSYKSLDSELMYDYPEPPPYTMSRTHFDMDRMHNQPNGLDILASASLIPLQQARHQSQISSERSMTAISDRSLTAPSERSFATTSATSYENDDEERYHKRPRPQPSSNSLGSDKQVVYLSSRSKRKVPVKQPRQPGESSSSKFPKLNNFLHRSDHGKDKAQPPAAEASAS